MTNPLPRWSPTPVDSRKPCEYSNSDNHEGSLTYSVRAESIPGRERLRSSIVSGQSLYVTRSPCRRSLLLRRVMVHRSRSTSDGFRSEMSDWYIPQLSISRRKSFVRGEIRSQSARSERISDSVK